MDILLLNPDVLHGGRVWVELPGPPYGYGWRVEWATVWADVWHVAAEELGEGPHFVPDLPPVPQHEAR